MPLGARDVPRSIEAAARAIRRHRLSPLELAEATLARIERLEPSLVSFITVTGERALADARRTTRELARPRDRGPLHGIPIALKDLVETARIRTTGGSKLLARHVPAHDAAVAARLRGAGTVLVGKTNLHEWAFGVTNANPHFGRARNPYDPSRISGGSSGGSAVALAARLCLGAIGTDTGGSIRIPASLCGIVGLKPTYGRVSVRGVLPLAWSLDHVGPMARTVRDAAILYAAIAGHDPADPLSADAPLDDALAGIERGVRGLRLAVPRDHFFDGLDPEVERSVRRAIGLLRRLGARVREVALPFAPRLGPTQRVIIGTESYALHADRLRRRAAAYGPDVRSRLLAARRHSAADYVAALRVRAEIRAALVAMLRHEDALLTPTTVAPAPRHRARGDVATARRLTALTSPFNFTGLPAISVPCGATKGGLPIGLQIVSGPWREATVLRVARAVERELDLDLEPRLE